MPRTSRRDRTVLGLLIAYPVVVSLASIANVILPQRGGLIALSQVFAPHLLVPAIFLVPVAWTSRRRWLRLALVVTVAIGAVRFGPGLMSIPPAPPSSSETVVPVLSWNLGGGTLVPGDVVSRLRASDADVVALQELTPEHAAAIRTDPGIAARYPYVELVPRGGSDGLGLLSRFPIGAASDDLDPPVQVIELDLPDRKLWVINSHPISPHFPFAEGASVASVYDPGQRDRALGQIRLSIERVLAAKRPLIVLGDFNVTDREPGFLDLSGGLWDAHDEVGLGLGSTWRPREIEFMPFGLLRIDYFLGGPGTRALTVGEDCTPRGSDHCILVGSVAIE